MPRLVIETREQDDMKIFGVAGIMLWLAACASAPERDLPPTRVTSDPRSSIPALFRPAPPPDVEAAPIWARRLRSGVAYTVIATGAGAAAVGARDFIEYNVTAWRADGTAVDTNLYRDPRRLPLFQTSVTGYREAILGMRRGERRRIWVPSRWAEASLGSGPLTYDVELVALVKAPDVPDDVAAPPPGAGQTATGAVFRVLRRGAGQANPDPWDDVRLHLTGWTSDGRMFDSSVAKGRPETHRVDQLAAGLRDAILTMVAGERRRVWIPAPAAPTSASDRPREPVVYDLELLDIIDQPAPPITPVHVAAPPATAKRTRRGVFYEVIGRGGGAKVPTIWDEVEINYAGWTPDGKLFDTSIGKGVATYPVAAGVIVGWTDVFTHMAVGDKWRVWIPGELGYHGVPDKPHGMTVFEIELVKLVDRPKPPRVPRHLASVPRDAAMTPGGVHIELLEPGRGSIRPSLETTVVVDYTGWTTKGDLIDSSIVRGYPHTSVLKDLMPGMVEALQTMVVGQKARVWIPHAFDGRGRSELPRGTVVFDVELVAIK
jgi:FKBP-type peptidyl-prolyl cis-trans isomerase